MPGPILDEILLNLKESDKEQFRVKILKQEEALNQQRVERGEMTRDQLMEEQRRRSDPWYAEEVKLKEDSLRKEKEQKEREAQEGNNTQDKAVFDKFLDKLK